MLTKLLEWIARFHAAYTVAQLLDNSPRHNDTQPSEIVRLRRDVLDRLEKECAPPYVGPTTTDIQAGYALGVQAVLQKLRNGYALD